MKTLDELRDWVLERRQVFARQGTVVATWRSHRGRQLGPYFRLMYRDEGRQHSLYLGRSGEAADEIARLLGQLQAVASQRRRLAGVMRQVRRSLRGHKAQWQQELAPLGLCVKGTEIRRFPSVSASSRRGGYRTSLGVHPELPHRIEHGHHVLDRGFLQNRVVAGPSHVAAAGLHDAEFDRTGPPAATV
jgi:hypothetical protein